MSRTTPSSLYQQQLAEGKTPDPVQAFAVQELDALHGSLTAPRRGLFGRKKRRGLYLHGSVGIGKTFLMDLFFDSLPEGRKRRVHFHQFMQSIHQALQGETGHKDPLERIGKVMADEIDVLCLDELFITDITDGIIVYRLFDSLFRHGVVLVTTSNFPPDKLYKDDLQPQLFQPAIELIQANTQTLYLDSQVDYRLQQQGKHQTYFHEDEQDFAELFNRLNDDEGWHDSPLELHHRPVNVLRQAQRLAWFDFDALCQGPRSQRDYLALGDQFDIILLSGIPQMAKHQAPDGPVMGIEEGEAVTAKGKTRKTFTLEDNAIRRFISLVDVLYDNGNLLYLSAAVPLDELYRGEALQFEFGRTRSRITEMQSQAWLDRFRG